MSQIYFEEYAENSEFICSVLLAEDEEAYMDGDVVILSVDIGKTEAEAKTKALRSAFKRTVELGEELKQKML